MSVQSNRRPWSLIAAFLMGGLVASILAWRSGWQWPSIPLLVGATLAGGVWFLPRLFQPLETGWDRLICGLTWAFTVVLLLLVYLLLVTPYAWFLRLFGHDPLKLRSCETTGWSRREPVTSPKDYLRPF